MKTAVSLPDNLFSEAEKTARRLKVSRSQFYAMAIEEFISRRKANAITERLNQVYSQHRAEVDPVLQIAQLDSIKKQSW